MYRNYNISELLDLRFKPRICEHLIKQGGDEHDRISRSNHRLPSTPLHRGPERNAKLYFTTEGFSVDDKYFYFNKDVEAGVECYRADVESGELTLSPTRHTLALPWIGEKRSLYLL